MRILNSENVCLRTNFNRLHLPKTLSFRLIKSFIKEITKDKVKQILNTISGGFKTENRPTFYTENELTVYL